MVVIKAAGKLTGRYHRRTESGNNDHGGPVQRRHNYNDEDGTLPAAPRTSDRL